MPAIFAGMARSYRDKGFKRIIEKNKFDMGRVPLGKIGAIADRNGGYHQRIGCRSVIPAEAGIQNPTVFALGVAIQPEVSLPWPGRDALLGRLRGLGGVPNPGTIDHGDAHDRDREHGLRPVSGPDLLGVSTGVNRHGQG